MRHAGVLAILALVLGGCQTITPQMALRDLPNRDPKYNTPACREARAQASAWDDRDGERAARRFVFANLGLAGGVVNLIEETRHEIRRDTVRWTMQRACMTNPPPRPESLRDIVLPGEDPNARTRPGATPLPPGAQRGP